ncbi:putative membrane protein [Escherichia coli 2-427-07_S4_C2]|nr:hypothetical protein DH22_3246 [Escherichia coli]KDY17766.1 putative membrane protein [Escherichia coli 2-316-03_S4_C3]KDY45822.1 putative membrane protein [Escherichia coli 2-427-07_S4_C2]KEJ36948.1 putative membrane protein [Escherichia coli 2-460-02_S1_C3]KEJ53691.1 putative membrane protein [Escherichia coli 3-020-07_S4_C1]KEO36012.1 putative membrane protein [Escherichia coli 2-460-02_S1_C2]CDK87665.1 hypothetical protein [Escherichia coli IS29]CDL02712.1 hypothetical protein [Escher
MATAGFLPRFAGMGATMTVSFFLYRGNHFHFYYQRMQ